MDTRAKVKHLFDAGVARSEIATRLGLARPTVEYHLQRLAEPSPEGRDGAAGLSEGGEGARGSVETRARVAELLAAGLSRTQIAKLVGVGKGTVAYHARRLGSPVDDRCARRYDWNVIRAYYDAGHPLSACIARYGFSRQSWHDAVKRGAVVPRPAAMPLDELLVSGVYRGRRNLKERLIREGLKAGTCESCGLSDWRGRPLSLSLHHHNGDRDDNRLGNLQLLCPNCHSQTENFSGRNRRRAGPATNEAP